METIEQIKKEYLKYGGNEELLPQFKDEEVVG